MTVTAGGSMSACAGEFGNRIERADNRLLPPGRAAADDGHRRVGRTPVRDQRGRDGLDIPQSHQYRQVCRGLLASRQAQSTLFAVRKMERHGR